MLTNLKPSGRRPRSQPRSALWDRGLMGRAWLPSGSSLRGSCGRPCHLRRPSRRLRHAACHRQRRFAVRDGQYTGARDHAAPAALPFPLTRLEPAPPPTSPPDTSARTLMFRPKFRPSPSICSGLVFAQVLGLEDGSRHCAGTPCPRRWNSSLSLYPLNGS